MSFDCLKAFLADIVLDAAGILGGYGLVNSQRYQPGGEQLVALIDHLGDFPARFRQIDKTFLGHGDMAGLAQMLHGYADAGFFKAQFGGDIHGADYGIPFAEHQYGFQIIFCGFVCLHDS